MRRILSFILLLAFCVPFFAACENTPAGETQSEEESSMPLTPDSNAATVWQDSFADEKNGFADASAVYGIDAYSDGVVSEEYASLPAGDTRYIFKGEEKTRVAVLSEGYALTLPGNDITADFSLGALRSKYHSESLGYMLTVTFENQSPYIKNAQGFEIYFREWLIRYLDMENSDKDVTKFFADNSLRYTRKIGQTTELLDGFTVNYYDVQINVAPRVEYDCYSIAVVRPTASYEYFWLFVMKSGEPMYETMDEIVASFKEIDKNGTPVNSVGSYELKIPEFWNDETKAYYDKILNQTTVDFGAFYEKNDPAYVEWLSSEDGIGQDMDIFMTYIHVGWYGKDYEQTRLSEKMDFINQQAGGNGFNGKPVLELTYQYTTTNNELGAYTPMYDILRGRLDEEFRQLAADIKTYGKPVLFRVNNEMNTDWTSYSGIQTLLDPDIFIETWRRLYDIFKEEGVDNCIWIWNPIAHSCPYSNWGDQLNYWPGSDYVQMLGLTYYQMNNDTEIESFKDMYTELYKKNTPWFDNFPAILGEFACGAGAEVTYDWDKGAYVPVPGLEEKKQWQAEWIEGMFDCFMKNQEAGYEFCKNIKCAVWFSANDYVTVDGETKIINYLKLDDGVPLALEAINKGYGALKEKRED